MNSKAMSSSGKPSMVVTLSDDDEDEETEDVGASEFAVEAIRDRRRDPVTNLVQYLVKWENYPESDNEWVVANQLRCPELLAEFKKTHPISKSPSRNCVGRPPSSKRRTESPSAESLNSTVSQQKKRGRPRKSVNNTNLSPSDDRASDRPLSNRNALQPQSSTQVDAGQSGIGNKLDGHKNPVAKELSSHFFKTETDPDVHAIATSPVTETNFTLQTRLDEALRAKKVAEGKLALAEEKLELTEEKLDLNQQQMKNLQSRYDKLKTIYKSSVRKVEDIVDERFGKSRQLAKHCKDLGEKLCASANQMQENAKALEHLQNLSGVLTGKNLSKKLKSESNELEKQQTFDMNAWASKHAAALADFRDASEEIDELQVKHDKQLEKIRAASLKLNDLEARLRDKNNVLEEAMKRADALQKQLDQQQNTSRELKKITAHSDQKLKKVDEVGASVLEKLDRHDGAIPNPADDLTYI